MRFETPSDLAAAVNRLTSIEPRFMKVVACIGLPPLRHSGEGLKPLLRIVTDQLISLKAGEAIWNRLTVALDPFDPEVILAYPEAGLQKLGLSRAKARTFHAAARAFGSGSFALSSNQLPNDVERRLLEIQGVGPWTAHVYLLTGLRFADAWPAADLALQRAAMDLLSLPTRPTAREMTKLGETWKPYRSAAALLLWSHYRHLKQMPQA